MQTKTCPKCRRELALSEYHKSASKGVQSRCKDCQRQRLKESLVSVEYTCIDCGDKKTIKISNSFKRRTHNKRCRKCAKENMYQINDGQHPNYKGNSYFTGSKYSAWVASAKVRNHSWDLTKEDLIIQLKKQNGICALSAIEMDMTFKDSITKPSLDRIDPNKGYSPDNIQFVCSCVNIMKNKFSEEFFIDMCRKISKFNQEN